MADYRQQNQTQSGLNLFVTGQPGIGKTTLILKIVSKLPLDAIAGFYTVEAFSPETGERIGLDIMTLTGERAPLCRLRRGCGPKVGKYYFAMEEFERVVLPHLTPNSKIKLHIIDEVGRMALYSKRFSDSVTALLDSPEAAVFGSLPAPRYGHPLPFVENIKKRSDTSVLTLSKANRDETALQLEDILAGLLIDEAEYDSSSGSRGRMDSCFHGVNPMGSDSGGSQTLYKERQEETEYDHDRNGRSGGMGSFSPESYYFRNES